MKQLLIDLSLQRRYWVALVILGILLESAALYSQYVQGEWPCVLCIHIRIWILGFIVIGLAAILFNRWTPVIQFAHLLNSIVMAGFVERSWRVLAVERGWIFGSCDMDAGLPHWFALDQWFPALFEVQAACGYTPLILFDITMAEILLVLSALLFSLSVALFTASWFNN